MKTKLILVLALLALPVQAWAAGENAKGHTTTSGYLIGDDANAYVGFNGATRVRKQAATVSADKVLQNYGLKATGQDYSVQHVTKAITAANIIAMYTTPIKVLESEGAGKSIIVHKVAFTITRTATAFTGGGVVIVQYDSTANGAGQQALDSTLAATVVTGAAGTSISFRNGAVISDSANTVTQDKALYLSNATAVFAAGTGTATVDIWYTVL